MEDALKSTYTENEVFTTEKKDKEKLKENGIVKEKKKKEKDTKNVSEAKKRKNTSANQRKKIRKLLTQDKLQPETLTAIQEEEQRQKRLEFQKQNAEVNLQQNLLSKNVNNKTETLSDLIRGKQSKDYKIEISKTNGKVLGGVFKIPQEQLNNNESNAECSDLSSLLKTELSQDNTSTVSFNVGDIKSIPIKSISPIQDVSLSNSISTDDVICISSDDEDTNASNSVQIASDSDDDVICTGDNFHTIADNGGVHVDDSVNVHDENGRVLVNVNKTPTEDPIYLADRLSNVVKPHQIGGIRFMFDNIVESLSTYNKGNGLGCILAHAMGLGKTLQVISFIDIFLRYTRARTVLCIVPVNTLLNWVTEFSNWLNIECCNTNNNVNLTANLVNDHNKKVEIKLYMLGDGQKTTDSRTKVVSQWQTTGGVLLMGYEMYRQLASKKVSRRRRKKKNSDTIDIDEEDRLVNLLCKTYENLVNPGPDLVICDEGHRIKNSHASISKVLKQIRTQRRIVLTGYPLQNNLMEYWCMVDFVRPNFLGTRQEFSNMFERPIHNGQCLDSTPSDIKLMRYRSYVLFSQLKGFVQRRSHEVLKENLPEKQEYVLLVRLSEWQRKLYNFFIKEQLENSSNWYSLNPIKAFSICCKIWNHPDILYFTAKEKQNKQQIVPINDNTTVNISAELLPIDVDLDIPESLEDKKLKSNTSSISDQSSNEKENSLSYDWAYQLLIGYEPNLFEISGKLLIFMELLKQTVQLGERLLLFSQSLNTLSLIEKFLSRTQIPVKNEQEVPKVWIKNESYFRLDGNTNAAERERLVTLFNSPNNLNVHLFLLSTKAGCLGINLTGANRVVVFDASWNPCHDAQAVCRVYRYGQKKQCHIYRLVSDQTMEKKIYDRQISKQGMSDRVVDKLNPIQSITRADVSKLLYFSDEELPRVDVTNINEQYNDDVLKTVCKKHNQWLTKMPFLHESLFIDNKKQRLTTDEISAAQRDYNIEKRSSSACNYKRQSYTGFYGSQNNPQEKNNINPSFIRSSSMVNLGHVYNKTVGNETKPLLQTPIPMQVLNSMKSRQENSVPSLFDSTSLSLLSKAGISVNKLKADNDISIPNQMKNISGNGNYSSQPQVVVVKSGETMFIIHGRKGVYMATVKGHIFAKRSQILINNNPKLQFDYESESKFVHKVVHAMAIKMMYNYRYEQNYSSPNMRTSKSYPNFPSHENPPPMNNHQGTSMLSSLLASDQTKNVPSTFLPHATSHMDTSVSASYTPADTITTNSSISYTQQLQDNAQSLLSQPMFSSAYHPTSSSTSVPKDIIPNPHISTSNFTSLPQLQDLKPKSVFTTCSNLSPYQQYRNNGKPIKTVTTMDMNSYPFSQHNGNLNAEISDVKKDVMNTGTVSSQNTNINLINQESFCQYSSDTILQTNNILNSTSQKPIDNLSDRIKQLQNCHNMGNTDSFLTQDTPEFMSFLNQNHTESNGLNLDTGVMNSLFSEKNPNNIGNNDMNNYNNQIRIMPPSTSSYTDNHVNDIRMSSLPCDTINVDSNTI